MRICSTLQPNQGRGGGRCGSVLRQPRHPPAPLFPLGTRSPTAMGHGMHGAVPSGGARRTYAGWGFTKAPPRCQCLGSLPSTHWMARTRRSVVSRAAGVPLHWLFGGQQSATVLVEPLAAHQDAAREAGSHAVVWAGKWSVGQRRGKGVPRRKPVPVLAQQGPGADCLQRALRSRCLPRMTPRVRPRSN